MNYVTRYVTRIHSDWREINATKWNDLLAEQTEPTPFMRYEYLSALQLSGSATLKTGWDVRIVTLWLGDNMIAACPMYIKPHSYGEYVFDFTWAKAYEQHGLNYYPKAVVAVPFTPVPGTRLLAIDDKARAQLILACQALCEQENISSLHVLFTAEDDRAVTSASSLMERHTVQFHWTNQGYSDFDGFLGHLTQDKRKKIKQERRKVRDAGVTFRHSVGADITSADWDFFYACYERTYLEHGNAPYLTLDFFQRMARDMPENWLLFIAEFENQSIAASLIAIQDVKGGEQGKVAYGRYWGALARVDCLHFEACYYQPLTWCIANNYQRFEGGAQGEHKMARALMPVKATSLHHIAHPEFAKAIGRFLEREQSGIENYQISLKKHSPMKRLIADVN